ncbi:Enoyl-(Acyl carrier protein) reductase, partial [Rhizoctonia solani]
MIRALLKDGNFGPGAVGISHYTGMHFRFTHCLGRSLAAAVLAHGASVVIASSSQEKVNAALEKLKQEVPPAPNATITGQAVDLKDFTALKEFLSNEGPFDHFVITAGDLPGNFNFPDQEIDPAITKSYFELALVSGIGRRVPSDRTAQHIDKNKLINPGGSIIQTIGASHYRPPPGWGLISAVVGAVESSTRGLAIDLKPIRCPGLVDTEFHDSMPTDAKEQFFQSQREKLPVGHVGTPEEVAEAYIFAMKCTYLTGQVIVMDGGGVLV